VVEFYDLERDPLEESDLLVSESDDPPALDAGAAAALERLAAELNRLTGVCVALDDMDSDCVADAADNCPTAPNGPLEAEEAGRGNQVDSDGDGSGDPCDEPTKVLVLGQPDALSAGQQLLVHALRVELRRAHDFEAVSSLKASSRLRRAVGNRDSARALRWSAREAFDEREWPEAVKTYRRAIRVYERGLAAPGAFGEYLETLAMLGASQAAAGLPEAATTFDEFFVLAPNFRPVRGSFEGEVAKAFEAAAARSRKAPTPTLRIASEPANAAIYLDDRFVGVAPIHGLELPVGRHHLRAELPGHRWRLEELALALDGGAASVKLSESKELTAARDAAVRLFAETQSEARNAADEVLVSSQADEIWTVAQETPTRLQLRRWRRTGEPVESSQATTWPETLGEARDRARKFVAGRPTTR
jgi:hypothetical protein